VPDARGSRQQGQLQGIAQEGLLSNLKLGLDNSAIIEGGASLPIQVQKQKE
jgi:hypothetical protein